MKDAAKACGDATDKFRDWFFTEGEEGDAPPVPGAEKEPGKTRGPSEIWTKPGGIEEANRDFDGLKPSGVKDISNGGRTGVLPDGRRIVVRPNSNDGRPTVEIQDGRGRTKVRYN
ncbi:hypothetical protein [Chitinimonas sp. BJB300]|uniref:hypothetical protein n=1 Tax=Chitinimonas sp. BJB300 TaxID=1559339 RepID=UPI001111F4D8|nr:hypothetical protein [Chitinimonas sp. BJB300]TSJ88236.1 hypothetical protein FG002_012080 [Chitinimonas sp. BJB300]